MHITRRLNAQCFINFEFLKVDILILITNINIPPVVHEYPNRIVVQHNIHSDDTIVLQCLLLCLQECDHNVADQLQTAVHHRMYTSCVLYLIYQIIPNLCQIINNKLTQVICEMYRHVAIFRVHFVRRREN